MPDILFRQLAINKIHNESTKNRTQMTLIVMIDADFSWIIRGYHNYLRHLRSIVFVVYFCELPYDFNQTASPKRQTHLRHYYARSR